MGYDDDDPIIRRRRRSADQSVLVLAIVGVFALLAVVAVGGMALFLWAGRPGPAVVAPVPIVTNGAPEASVDWNHADLLEHLNARGMGLRMVKAHKGDLPAVYLYEPVQKFVSVTGDRDNPEAVDAGFGYNSPHVVLVSLAGTEREARDAAGVHGAEGWSWGRFAFRSNRKSGPLLGRIKAALGN